MVGLRARANLLLDRLQFLGPGAKGAYERSKASSSKTFGLNSPGHEYACRVAEMRRDDLYAHRTNNNAGHSSIGRLGRTRRLYTNSLY